MTNKINNQPGIYQIFNLLTGISYIGQSKNPSDRCTTHKRDLRKRKDSPLLQKAYQADGPTSFEYRLIQNCSAGFLTSAENYWIYYFSKNGGVYNIRWEHRCLSTRRNPESPSPMLGRKHSQETKDNMSKARLGNTNALGHKHSAEFKMQVSKFHTGRIRDSKTRQKISDSLKGNTNCVGKIMSDENKLKLRKANLGRKLSAEHRAKLSIAQKQRQEREKNLRMCEENHGS